MCDYPVADEKLIDEELNLGMETVLGISNLGHSARNQSSMKNRQPLSKIIVATAEKIELSEDLKELVKDELNVQAVEFKHDAKEYLNYDLKPQLKILGPKYGSKIGAIRNWLSTCDASSVVDTVNAGKTVKFDVQGEEVELSKEDLLISPLSKEGFVSESDGRFTVVLDTELTPELVELGLVREFISKVQQTRKDSGFEVVDHINIYVNASNETNEILNKYSKDICSGTLADSLETKEVSGMQDIELNSESVKLKVEKV